MLSHRALNIILSKVAMPSRRSGHTSVILSISALNSTTKVSVLRQQTLNHATPLTVLLYT